MAGDTLEHLLSLMTCPSCGRDTLRQNSTALVCGDCGTRLPIEGGNIIIDLSPDAGTPEWQEKQAASVSRYTQHDYATDHSAIRDLFGGFIAVTLERDAAVLDIGCGLIPGLPPYVRQLGLRNYIGLEPLTAPIERPFPCLAGATAEDIPLRKHSLDAVIFASVLDHIADVDKAMERVREVVKPGGRIYIWSGLYEPEMLAWGKSFHNVTHQRGGMAYRAVRSAAIPIEHGLLLWRMWRRGRRTKKGLPLDNLHERWFTRASLAEALNRWGLTVERSVLVPGAPSYFVEARV